MRTPNLKFFDRLGIIIYNIIDAIIHLFTVRLLEVIWMQD